MLIHRCGDEFREERMRLIGAGLEFGMELHADIEIAIREFHGLHDMSRGGRAAEGQAALLERLFIFIIELISMTVALFDKGLAVTGIHRRSLLHLARIGAETHRASLDDAMLIGHEIDDEMGAFLIEFAAVRVLIAEDMTGVFDDADLHAEANAEIRELMLSRILTGGDHPLDAPVAEAAGDEDAGAILENFRGILLREFIALHPLDLDLLPDHEARVLSNYGASGE